jgi:predicted glycoside hydrolase/deacetylase ChbG (UPF0249 family)
MLAMENELNGSVIASSLSGRLIINADDWGRDRETTDRTLDCVRCGAVSSVSAMVFMKDSERAAALAGERCIDTALHLNFTTDLSAPYCSSRLVEHQVRIGRFLMRNSLAQACFHPVLDSSFRYVVTAQFDEFERLYGRKPERIDGHHHMHLCANVLLGGLLPAETIVRRSFSPEGSKKGRIKRAYRRAVDSLLARRYSLTDFFFSLPPLEPPERLARMFHLAERFVVEVETHPINHDEYSFLASGEIFRRIGQSKVATAFALSVSGAVASHRGIPQVL